MRKSNTVYCKKYAETLNSIVDKTFFTRKATVTYPILMIMFESTEAIIIIVLKVS